MVHLGLAVPPSPESRIFPTLALNYLSDLLIGQLSSCKATRGARPHSV